MSLFPTYLEMLFFLHFFYQGRHLFQPLQLLRTYWSPPVKEYVPLPICSNVRNEIPSGVTSAGYNRSFDLCQPVDQILDFMLSQSLLRGTDVNRACAELMHIRLMWGEIEECVCLCGWGGGRRSCGGRSKLASTHCFKAFFAARDRTLQTAKRTTWTAPLFV